MYIKLGGRGRNSGKVRRGRGRAARLKLVCIHRHCVLSYSILHPNKAIGIASSQLVLHTYLYVQHVHNTHTPGHPSAVIEEIYLNDAHYA